MDEGIHHFTDADVTAHLGWKALIDGLDDAFRRGGESPPRPHYDIRVPGEPNGTLLLMPAWIEGHYIGLKTATVFPGNAARGAPSVNAQYQLFDAMNGRIVAILEGGALTARRTAAASALASRYLSRPQSRRLLVVGTGRLSVNLVEAHAAVRSLDEIVIWGRNTAKAEALAGELVEKGFPARPAVNLEQEVRVADIISCCTLSHEPLVEGKWLAPGTHLDLVGAFTPQMRETDDIALQRGTVFVDTFEGALAEAGEIVQAIERGALQRKDILASLFELARAEHCGRMFDEDITVFKSVGCSLEDLTAAVLCVERSAVGSCHEHTCS